MLSVGDVSDGLAILVANLLERPGVGVELLTPGGWRLTAHHV
jgi:hypothetical protein